MDWGKKWLDDFNAGKTQLVLFDQSTGTGAVDLKADGSVFCPRISAFFGSEIKFRGNNMKVHFASALPWQCFCEGW